MAPIPGEDAEVMIEMTAKNLEYDISLVTAVAGFERIDSSFERNSSVGKKLTNNTAC